MPGLLKRCEGCRRYTISPEDTCPYCGAPLRSAHPPPFSMKMVKYAAYIHREEKP